MCSAETFFTRMERAPRDRKKTLLQFAIQRPGEMLYVPHLSTVSVLTPDLGTTTFLAGWNCCTKDDTKFITQSFGNFCSGAPRFKWRRQYRERLYEGLNRWGFSSDYQAEAIKHANNYKNGVRF